MYNFTLVETYRGKAFAKQAIAALEKRAKTLGVQKLSLQVFAQNQMARSLYEKSGFAETGIYMSKLLSTKKKYRANSVRYFFMRI